MIAFFQSLGAFTLVLSPLVFFHELGHYLVAKSRGVGISCFSIGFGPQLFGWTDASGTRWKVSLFLLGGYVKMLGDADMASSTAERSEPFKASNIKGETFHEQSPFGRMLIALAGPFSNYLLAFVLFCSLLVSVGEPKYQAVVGELSPSSLAAKAGVQQQDRLLGEDGKAFTHFGDFTTYLKEHPANHPLRVILERHSKQVPVLFAGNPKETGTWLGKLGIPPHRSHRSYEPLSFEKAVSTSLKLINPWTALQSMTIKSMGGPIAIAQQAGSIWHEGWVSLLFFAASISAALGFFNLLPIPFLDGGMVFFSVLELIIRRPLSQRAQEFIHIITLFLLGGLFFWLSFQDILRIPSVLSLLKAIGISV